MLSGAPTVQVAVTAVTAVTVLSLWIGARALVAMRQGHGGMSLGNVVGSNVLGILGVASLLRPLAVGGAAIETLAWLTALTVLMVAALWSGQGLSRSEGALFVCSELARWTLGLLGIFG